ARPKHDPDPEGLGTWASARPSISINGLGLAQSCIVEGWAKHDLWPYKACTTGPDWHNMTYLTPLSKIIMTKRW
ncbi:hypothetical protein PanWU01x14_021150, partial [Parasponia andersonii]